MNESAAPALNLLPSTPLDPATSAGPLDPLKSGHPRNGKIAQMPRDQRDALNRMLSNGAPYDSIIDHFHSLGSDLNRQNISNWKAGGYEDWLAQQEWVAEMDRHSEWASDLAGAGGADDTALHQGVIRLAVIQIFKSLKSERFKDDAPNYTRLLNTLARLSREALCLRKHSEACAAAQAALAPAKDPKRELSDEDRRAIVNHVDRVLGLAPDRPNTPVLQAPPDPNPDRPRFPDGNPVPITSEQEHSTSDQTSISSMPPEGESKVIDLVPISGPVASHEPPQTSAETALPPSDASQAQPPAESGSSQSNPTQDQATTAPAPELCQQCGQELPALLPNGERPDFWCPNRNCQTSLPDPPRRTVQPQLTSNHLKEVICGGAVA